MPVGDRPERDFQRSLVSISFWVLIWGMGDIVYTRLDLAHPRITVSLKYLRSRPICVSDDARRNSVEMDGWMDGFEGGGGQIEIVDGYHISYIRCA